MVDVVDRNPTFQLYLSFHYECLHLELPLPYVASLESDRGRIAKSEKNSLEQYDGV